MCVIGAGAMLHRSVMPRMAGSKDGGRYKVCSAQTIPSKQIRISTGPVVEPFSKQSRGPTHTVVIVRQQAPQHGAASSSPDLKCKCN
jgi:hypothetical protein